MSLGRLEGDGVDAAETFRVHRPSLHPFPLSLRITQQLGPGRAASWLPLRTPDNGPLPAPSIHPLNKYLLITDSVPNSALGVGVERDQNRCCPSNICTVQGSEAAKAGLAFKRQCEQRGPSHEESLCTGRSSSAESRRMSWIKVVGG